MKVYAGTSGYSYKPWKGAFYPVDLPARRMLEFYASKLPAVEINNTFYRMPKVETLETWRAAVGPEFRFVIKAPRRITHHSRLRDCEDSVRYLIDTTSVLGEARGAFLLQLPPFLKKDAALLSEFLGTWPSGVRAAFEFRHPSWFDEETYDVLRRSGAALCIADSGTDRDTPFVGTTDWGYLRLRREDYDEDSMQQWAERVAEQDWADAFVFFKHEDAGAGPRMAADFAERTAALTG